MRPLQTTLSELKDLLDKIKRENLRSSWLLVAISVGSVSAWVVAIGIVYGLC